MSVHDEREVLVMVVGVVGKDVEHKPAEHFLAIHFGQMQFPANGQQFLVTVGFGIHCRKGLGVDFSRLVSVEALGQEMLRDILKTFDSWDQEGNHVIVDGTGTLVTYYPDGSIEQTATYKNCHFDGSNEGWYPSGQKEHEFFYKDGKPTGVWRTWDENGELTSTENH